MSATDAVRAALADFDRCFASGNADALAELFAGDALLLLQYREPIEGRPAIRDRWVGLFSEFDSGAWRADHAIVEVHGDRAFTLSIYSETLIPRRGGASQLVNGRFILFLRRDPDGAWRVTHCMNSHARPIELVESDSASVADT